MQVAVISVRMMQGPAHLVVDVLPVRNGVMSAFPAVKAFALDRRAAARAAPVDLETVLVGMGIVGRVEMPVVKVISVVSVSHGLVPAIRAMLMWMGLVLRAGHRFASREILSPEH